MGSDVTSFEQACADTQRAAEGVAKAANVLVRAARQMAKAASEGDVGKIRKAMEGLETAALAARQEARNATTAWPFTAEHEEALLRDAYEQELIAAGKERGLKIRHQDGQLVAFPSLVRIVPEQRALLIDRTRVTAIRPSRVAELLLENQSKKPRFKPEQFIEALYRAYLLVVGRSGTSGTTLAQVYKAFTLLPGSAREYSKSDFARDLYFLERSRVSTTKTGARLSLPASTGTKASASLFTFVGPEGDQVTYYGIKFVEAAK